MAIFMREDVIQSLMNGLSVVSCSAITPHKLLISYLLPELELQGHRLINSEELEFGAQIGEGGFGRVFKGTWKTHSIAIKELLVDSGIENFDSFYQEATMMCGLDCQQLLRLHGICLHKPLRMILEFAPLGDLHKILTDTLLPKKENPMEEDYKIQVIVQYPLLS